MRVVNMALGLFFLGLGVVGIFLPVIPTTGPLLLALWFFARSSKRLHDWIVNHKVLGKYVHELWVQGGLTRRSKQRAIAAMSAVILLSALTMALTLTGRTLWMAEGGLFIGWAIATTFIATRKALDPVLPVVTTGENP